MTFFLTKKAVSDLKNIARYTEAEWGLDQRNAYLKQFDDSFHKLNESPAIGLKCNYIREGYRKHRVGRHFVFYQAVNNGSDIEITRILHERMAAEVHLSKIL